jgi:hypothetical protein
MTKTGETRPENDQTGFVLATSVSGVGTGERGDRVPAHAVPPDTSVAGPSAVDETW